MYIFQKFCILRTQKKHLDPLFLGDTTSIVRVFCKKSNLKTVYYYFNSFIFSVVREWSLMDLELKNYIQSIFNTTEHDERVLIAARGFINLFSFSRVHLMDYSVISGNLEGVLYVSNTGTIPLPLKKDNIRNYPLLRKAIRKQEAIYSFGPEYIQQSPAEIVALDMYRSYVIIVPITSNGNVIGYACPSFDNESETDSVTDALLKRLTLYGRLVGNALVSLNYIDNVSKLSKREVEILQRVSWGETVKEIAYYLQISEYTIQDYMKSSIKKLNAHNRMHAVSEALRLGIIT